MTLVKLTGESNGDGGDQYTGLDRFGRVVDQCWLTTTTGTAIDRFKYGYDEDGNVLVKTNLIDASQSELYHADDVTAGTLNAYNALNCLTDFHRGTLSDSNSDGTPDTVTTASRSQGITLDTLGNATAINTDGTSKSTTFDKQNRITSYERLKNIASHFDMSKCEDDFLSKVVLSKRQRMDARKRSTAQKQWPAMLTSCQISTKATPESLPYLLNCETVLHARGRRRWADLAIGVSKSRDAAHHRADRRIQTTTVLKLSRNSIVTVIENDKRFGRSKGGVVAFVLTQILTEQAENKLALAGLYNHVNSAELTQTTSKCCLTGITGATSVAEDAKRLQAPLMAAERGRSRGGWRSMCRVTVLAACGARKIWCARYE